jgi:hypothetical protein
MEPGPPKVASTLVAGLYSAVGVLLLWVSVRIGSLPLLIAVLFLCAVLLVVLLPAVSTQLSSDGISQLSWRGRVHLAWHEVDTATVQSRAIVLLGGGRRFSVPLIFFSDARAAFDFVRAHLPPRVRLNGT